jgi:hypothetical protein
MTGGRRGELPPVDLRHDVPAFTAGFGRGAEPAPGDPVSLAGQGVAADGDLEVRTTSW